MLEYRDGDGVRTRGQVARATRTALVLLAAVVVGALVAVVVSVSQRGARPVTNPPGMVDRIDFFDTVDAWARGQRERVDVRWEAPARLALHDARNKFPREGTWTSPEVSAAYAFTELLPSYNPNCPPETGLRIDVRTRDARSGAWSPWFYLGSWGKAVGRPQRVIKDAGFGEVDIDTLVLYRPADAYQARVSFFAFGLDDTVNPTLRRLAVCYSGVVANGEERARLVTPVVMPADFARDLPVPFRAQGNAARPLRPEICSPTSVSMVMQYHGFDRPTEENALAIYDSEYDLFGNWQRAVAWAGQNGFDAWLTRFRTWDQVKSAISHGQPIVASIRFKKGQCPSFVLKETAGHLIVIRGVTRDGDLIVNDPASRDRGNGAVYKASEMQTAWIDHGGVGYVIRKSGS